MPPSTTPSHSTPSPAPLAPTRENLAHAASLLAQGKLVIVPTETVYGIAFSLHSAEARQRIQSLKNLASPPAWVVHVPSPEAALAWALSLAPLGKRLLTKALPGPIAFQIKLSEKDAAAARTRLGPAADETLLDSSLTLRCPDFSSLQDLLARPALAQIPIAIIGAGNAAIPAPHEFTQIPDDLLAAVDASIDAGPTRYRKPSTLVRIEGNSYSVIRPGIIDERIIHRLADFSVLFVCTGNTCRSPMASALAAKAFADSLGIAPSDLPNRHILIQSAGLHTSRGLRATRESVQALADLGVDLSSHISQPATLDLLRRADVIYTMTDAHREEILDILPGAAEKTQRLDPDADVEDPYGSNLAAYRQVAARLTALVKRRMNELSL